ncbi:unnamed protein product [Coregonus sp. 'balchen']|nr:unnamed protein product [Coregonus sp. 'balchen']
MALYSISINLLVYVILALHHPDGKVFRDNLMPPMGIRQWATMPHIELNTNTINFHQRPWTTQNTNETNGHSLHKGTGEACVMVSLEPTATRVTTNNTYQLSGLVVNVSALRLEGQVVYPRSNHTKDSKNGTRCLSVWHTLRRWIGGKAQRQTCVLSRGCTSSCLMLQKQEIGSCPMGHCGLDKATTTQTRNSIDQKYRDVSALHQTTGDSTASLRTFRTRVAELRSWERAGASELVWKKMVEVINGADERKEAARCMFLALCCWLYGMGLLLTISVRGLLQIMVALELHGDEHKERGAERETDSCKDAQTAPVLVTPRGSTKKRARRRRRRRRRRQSNKGKH